MPKRLVYLLDYNLKNEVTCTTFITDVMKREAFGNVPLYDIKYAMRPSTDVKLSVLDRKIVMGLAMRSTRGDENIILSGLDSWEFLKTILQTKHAFWSRSTDHALSVGGDVSGELIWIDHPGGNIQPRARIVDGPGNALATTPPAYCNPEKNQIGRLTFEAPGTACADWIRARGMNLQSAHKWFSKLKQRHPDASLPLPPELDVTGFEGKPQTTLTLNAHLPASENSDEKVKIIPLAQTVRLELTFTYGKKTFEWDQEQQTTVVHQNSTITTIQRDSTFENDIVQKLATIGIKPDESASRAGMLSLYSRKFTFPDTFEQTFDQYLKNHFLRLVRSDNILLVDSAGLLERDLAAEIPLELQPNTDATFKLSIKDQKSHKAIDLVQLLKNYLSTLPNIPLDNLLEQIEKQTFTLIEKDTHQSMIIPGHQVVPLVTILIEIMVQADLKSNHIPLRLAAQLAIKADSNTAGHYEHVVPKALIEYLIAWNQQPLPETITTTAPNFKATLRDYQATGVAWITRAIHSGYGAILADEMGLGKTVQTLALLNSRTTVTKPTLLIAPSSLISTWHDEAGKFTPELKTHVQHGSERITDGTLFKDYALVITSYALLHRDAQIYHEVDWDGVVLDEAHFVKNNLTKTYQAIEQINSDWRLCLTGTPVENRLADLFSLFQLIIPGYLGRVSDWKKTTRASAQNVLSEDAILQLKQEIAPFILRRTKEEVLTELPSKTENLVPLELQPEERNAYNTILAATDKTIRHEIQRRGFAQSSITILNCLLRLRQCCCDPALIESFEDHEFGSNTHSTKTQHLLDWLPELIEQNHKVLVFSSFAQYLKKISQILETSGLNHSLLTGSTTDRDKEIRKFRQGDNDIFLLSLKAGGYGLTLTEADTVIHCDPWWNPAVEAQASARVHRIGQEKPVFIYKLVAEGTIESRILELQDEKRSLANSLLSQDQETWSLNEDGLQELLDH